MENILNQTVPVIGNLQISLGTFAAMAGGLVFVLLLFTAIQVQRVGAVRRRELENAIERARALEMQVAEISGQIRQFTEATANRDGQLARTLDQRLDQVSQNISRNMSDTTQKTGETLRQLYERMAVIDSAQKNITDLGSQMMTLQSILSNKQSRGAFGQGRMEAIIRDGLPSDSFHFQASLSNGKRPDCLISLPECDRKLVIDAKFPLEAFNAFKAATDDAATKQAVQRLRHDVSVHIKDIAQKYLIQGETHDTAIMFVPSETIYADLYESFEDLIQRAHRARVIIASPNILMLVVQTLQAVFKDVKMREQAGLIKAEVAHILDDTARLRDRVLDLQRHFGQATQDIDKILISSDKINRRGLKIEQMDLQHEDDRSDNASDLNRPRLAAGE